jgi:hypothetical protein
MAVAFIIVNTRPNNGCGVNSCSKDHKSGVNSALLTPTSGTNQWC